MTTTTRAPRPRECDLVMKGGITSGVVHPPAVLALHAAGYRFRSIGGTSAGAMAAAVAAAAQYGEATGGFEKLREGNDALGEPGVMKGLVRPSPDVEPLFAIASRMLQMFDEAPPRESAVRVILRELRRLDGRLRHRRGAAYGRGQAYGAWVGAGAGAVVGVVALLCTCLGAWAAGAAVSLRVGGIGAVVGAAFGLALAGAGRWMGRLSGVVAHVAQPEVAEGLFFGLCPGHHDAVPALTDWLHEQINGIAGKPLDAPLTFRDLAGAERPIELKMVTADLSQGRPHVLPFTRDRFVFAEREMARLFPASVVSSLTRHGAGLPQLPAGYHWLPEGLDLPVIVATRMSLGFPVLFAAVPLYRVKRDVTGPIAASSLEKHWFSDGGIASNFPIHFFDDWLPARPTFGIKLTTADAYREVTLPEPSDDAPVEHTRIEGLPGFLREVVETALDYRDNMQSVLPSYLERIVQVPLDDGERGLKVQLEGDVFASLVAKGRRAGELLDDFDLARHQWVRFAVLSAHLDRELRKLKDTFDGPGGYEAVFREQVAVLERSVVPGAPRAWYHAQPQAECERTMRRMMALLDLVAEWEAIDAKSGGGRPLFFRPPAAPAPESVLRVTPEL